MQMFGAVCFALVALLILIYTKNVVHPLAIFDFMWSVILFMESKRLYGLYATSDKIIWMIIIGVLSFNIGYFVYRIFRTKFHVTFSLGKGGVYVPKYGLLYFFSLLCFCFYLGTAITSISSIIHGDNLGDIRMMAQAGGGAYSGFSSRLLNSVSVIFVEPSFMVLQVIACVDFWFGRRDKILFVSVIVLILLNAIALGGRTSIVNFALYMVVGYVLRKKKIDKQSVVKHRKLINKSKIEMTVFIILLVIVLAWFTVSRTGATLSNNLYFYASMEPLMLNNWVQEVNNSGIVGWGNASLNGFGFAVLYIVKNLLSVPFPEHWNSIYQLISMTDSEWQIITSTGVTANAYVSGFWFLYLDGRIFGVIIGMLAYGAFFAGRLSTAIKSLSVKDISIFAFSLQGLLYFFIRFPFSNIYYAISFIMLCFFTFKKIEN